MASASGHASSSKQAHVTSGLSSSPQQNGHGKSAPVRASKAVSCNECRRLKLRCSKTWPCDMCVKRRLAHLCPDGVQKRERPRAADASFRPTAATGASAFAMDPYEGRDLPAYVSHAAGSVALGAPTGMAALSSSNNNNTSSDNMMGMQTRLESLERKIDLLLAGRSGAAMGGTQTPNGLHDLASIAMDPVRFAHAHHMDASETSRYRGTLSVHADGRSSYVGPHAHSVYLAREDLEGSGGSGTRSPAKSAASRPGSPTPVNLRAAALHNTVPLDEGVSPLGADASLGAEQLQEYQQQLAGWTVPGIRSPHSSAAIWNQLRTFLPTRESARRLVNVYYASHLFQHDIVTRQEMDAELWPLFYGDDGSSHERSDTPPPGFHPHRMSLFFAILALGVLFDVTRPQRDPVGRAFYLCSWNALALSNFTESTSTDTIHAVVHAALYLTWRRLSKYAESAWPLFGTIMSMMTRSGLHRDPAHFEMSDAERERRRRVFWDVQGVEVLRSLAFCRPPSILDRHVDTRLPSAWRVVPGQQRPVSFAERANAFFALKSYHAQLVNRILDECLCTSSTYTLTMEFDVRIQRLMRMIPTWFAPELIPLSKRSETGNEDMERAYWDDKVCQAMTEEMRHHIIHLNCHQLRLLLHRGWFSQALQQIGQQSDETLQEQTARPSSKEPAAPVRFQASVDAVNVCASSIIEIITSAWAHYPALVVRWMFFWNGLFSAAVCRGLYAVKRRRGGGALAAWRDLRAAIQLLRHAVDGWKPLEQPLGILLRLHQRAEKALGDSGASTTDISSAEVKPKDEHREGFELLGEGKRRVRFAPKRQSTASQSPDEEVSKRRKSRASTNDGLTPMAAPLDEAVKDQTKNTASDLTAQENGATPIAKGPFEFATDVLGLPTFDIAPGSLTPSASLGDTFTFSDGNPADFQDISSAMRMPASLPTFTLSSEDVHHSQQDGDATRGTMRESLLPVSAVNYLTLTSSPLNASQHPNTALSGGQYQDGSDTAHLKALPSTGEASLSSMSASPSHDVAHDSALDGRTPNAGVPGALTPSSAQLIQMLNSGIGWEDVATWDNFIFDL